jgi:hypothetical protein
MGRKKHSKMHVHESYMFALMYSDSLVQTPLLRSGLDLAVAVDLVWLRELPTNLLLTLHTGPTSVYRRAGCWHARCNSAMYDARSARLPATCRELINEGTEIHSIIPSHLDYQVARPPVRPSTHPPSAAGHSLAPSPFNCSIVNRLARPNRARYPFVLSSRGRRAQVTPGH